MELAQLLYRRLFVYRIEQSAKSHQPSLLFGPEILMNSTF